MTGLGFSDVHRVFTSVTDLALSENQDRARS